jgi:hypothetical protein
MHFSDHHNILRTPSDDWFDPILAVDTKLFVDPFLIFKDGDPTWAGAHDELIAHFQQAFELLAGAGCDQKSLAYRSAIPDDEVPRAGRDLPRLHRGGHRWLRRRW